MILETVRLSKSFNALQALAEVDMSVEKGQIFGIADPNDTGKSTLFNVISGAFQPSAGRIIFQSRDVTRLKAYEVDHALRLADNVYLLKKGPIILEKRASEIDKTQIKKAYF